MIPNYSGYQAYQKNKYETASPHRLIAMLYDGTLRFMNQAIQKIEQSDIEGSNIAINRAQDIVYELIACLNFDQGKEIANNLNNLYRYIIDLLIKSNIEKNTDALREAISIISEIKEAWNQIGKEVSVSNG
ncbi:flagellar export chaperone FliS [Paenibacillus sp. GXUN7292]|uniref:flagellar export chaperone FliS n=1 Tax=Paenibacillus sp. GXUN7292 TaxID=3422499 RepID=UPI003D7C8399